MIESYVMVLAQSSGLLILILILAASVIGVIRRRDALAIMALIGAVIMMVGGTGSTILFMNMEAWVSNTPDPGLTRLAIMSWGVSAFGNLVFAIAFVMMMSTLRSRNSEAAP